jgi:DNA-binding CsgD family transcriptional regulator
MPPEEQLSSTPRTTTPPPPQLSSLVDVLDMFEQGVVLLRSDLHPCYSNSAATELLETDSERDALTNEVRAVSRVALSGKAHATAEREIGTPAGTYRLRAKLLKQKLIDISSRTILVTIERANLELPSRDALIRRFAMTGREADVATLLARGASNSRIASELRISPHTARHHTENVLAKLNVHARAEVARAIVSGPSL